MTVRIRTASLCLFAAVALATARAAAGHFVHPSAPVAAPNSLAAGRIASAGRLGPLAISLAAPPALALPARLRASPPGCVVRPAIPRLGRGELPSSKVSETIASVLAHFQSPQQPSEQEALPADIAEIAGMRDLKGSISEIGAGTRISDRLEPGGLNVSSLWPNSKNASNERYGPSQFYVSRERLIRQLETEYAALAAPISRRKFVMAATSATSRADGRSWMGFLGQLIPGMRPVRVLVFARFQQARGAQQKTAIADMAVNMLSAVYSRLRDTTAFIKELTRGLQGQPIRIESVEGPASLRLQEPLTLGPLPAPAPGVKQNFQGTPMPQAALNDPLAKAAALNASGQFKGIFTEFGPGHGIAKLFLNAPFSGSIYEARHQSKAPARIRMGALLQEQFARLGAYDQKRRYALAATSERKGGVLEGVIGVLGESPQGENLERFTIRFRFEGGNARRQDEALGKLGANIVYALMTPMTHQQRMASLSDGLDGL
ncbi:MAG: hypothetical protein AAB036_02230 [Elusimicrobiota bacterium]